MKFFHLSDLHIGKQLHHYSLLEEQKHILKQVVELAETESSDAILIAGDIYDVPVPSAEAVALFDDFLGRFLFAALCQAGICAEAFYGRDKELRHGSEKGVRAGKNRYIQAECADKPPVLHGVREGTGNLRFRNTDGGQYRKCGYGGVRAL